MIELPNTAQLALLVHDMSNDALKPGGGYPGAGETPGTEELIAKSVLLLAAARKCGLAVFHTGHFLRDDALDAPLGGRSARLAVLRDGSWGAQPIDELKPAPGEWIIRKGGGFSAFTGTPLEKWLRRLGVTTVIISGAGTGAGISSTAYACRERDFASIIASDACNGAGTEQHAAAMLNLGSFAQVETTAAIVDALVTMRG